MNRKTRRGRKRETSSSDRPQILVHGAALEGVEGACSDFTQHRRLIPVALPQEAITESFWEEKTATLRWLLKVGAGVVQVFRVNLCSLSELMVKGRSISVYSSLFNENRKMHALFT